MRATTAVRRAIGAPVAAMLVMLVCAGSASAATVFSDGFESGDFGAWSTPTTAGDGTAAIQSTIVRTGALAAQLSESATAGSKALRPQDVRRRPAGPDRLRRLPGREGGRLRRQRPAVPLPRSDLGPRRERLPAERDRRHRPDVRQRDARHDDREARARHVGARRDARDHERGGEHRRGEPQRDAGLLVGDPEPRAPPACRRSRSATTPPRRRSRSSPTPSTWRTRRPRRRRRRSTPSSRRSPARPSRARRSRPPTARGPARGRSRSPTAGSAARPRAPAPTSARRRRTPSSPATSGRRSG